MITREYTQAPNPLGKLHQQESSAVTLYLVDCQPVWESPTSTNPSNPEGPAQQNVRKYFNYTPATYVALSGPTLPCRQQQATAPPTHRADSKNENELVGTPGLR